MLIFQSDGRICKRIRGKLFQAPGFSANASDKSTKKLLNSKPQKLVPLHPSIGGSNRWSFRNKNWKNPLNTAGFFPSNNSQLQNWFRAKPPTNSTHPSFIMQWVSTYLQTNTKSWKCLNKDLVNPKNPDPSIQWLIWGPKKALQWRVQPGILREPVNPGSSQVCRLNRHLWTPIVVKLLANVQYLKLKDWTSREFQGNK